MYVRSAQALAWLEPATLERGSPRSPLRSERASPAFRPRVIVARRPFDGRLGRYIAVRLQPGPVGSPPQLDVAIANREPDARGPRWVRASEALSEHEAARWARTGF